MNSICVTVAYKTAMGVSQPSRTDLNIRYVIFKLHTSSDPPLLYMHNLQLVQLASLLALHYYRHAHDTACLGFIRYRPVDIVYRDILQLSELLFPPFDRHRQFQYEQFIPVRSKVQAMVGKHEIRFSGSLDSRN